MNFILKKLLKIFLWVVFVLSAVFILLLSYAFHLSKDIKTPLLKVIASQIQGTLQIDSAKARFYPPGLQLEGIKIFTKEDKNPSIVIPELQLNFYLFALLQKKIEISLKVIEPEIQLPEKLSALFLTDKEQPTNNLNAFWWKRLEVKSLQIQKGHLVTLQSDPVEKVEIQNLNIEASQLSLETTQHPAWVQMEFEAPSLSSNTIAIEGNFSFESLSKVLKMTQAKFTLGDFKLDFSGEANLDSQTKRNRLNLNFETQIFSDSLKGALQLKRFVFKNSKEYFGTADLQLGPLPLPTIDLKDKMHSAALLSSLLGLKKSLNFKDVSNSTQIIGKQIDILKAQLELNPGKISIDSLTLENSYFSALGSGEILNENNIQLSATVILNPKVTAFLIPDVNLRASLTEKKGSINIPITVSGEKEEIQVKVGESYFRKLFTKAFFSNLKNKIFGEEGFFKRLWKKIPYFHSSASSSTSSSETKLIKSIRSSSLKLTISNSFFFETLANS